MAFVIKAAPNSDGLASLARFRERPMYGGNEIGVNDEVFVFSSETQGGHGLTSIGIVASVSSEVGNMISVEIFPIARAQHSLGNRELEPFRDVDSNQPETEIARVLYKHAHNKIARISDEAAAFLRGHFR